MKLLTFIKKPLSFWQRLAAGEAGGNSGGPGTGFTPEQGLLDMLDNSKDVIYYFQIEPEQKFIYLSPAIDLWLGEGTAAAAMKDPSVPFQLVHPDDAREMDGKVSDQVDYHKPLIQRWRDQDGVYHWFEERMTPVYQDGRLVALQGVTRNIDERMDHQQRLEYQATHDALTDLYNRAYFDTAMRCLDRDVSDQAGLIVIDIDKLKSVNDRFGHEAGDALLKRGADFLKQFQTADTMAARIGGDEFILLVEGDDAHRRVHEIVRKLGDGLHQYNASYPGSEIHLSYGCAYTEHTIGRMGELFRQADAEMYRNKAGQQRTGEPPSCCVPL